MLTSSRASVLSSHANTPPVTKTTVCADLLHPLNIITKLSVEVLCKDLGIFTRLEILLPVKEPKWDLELTRVLNDGNKLFNFIGGKFSGTLIDVDLSLFADKIGETTSETLNLCQAEDDISLALNVSVKNTQDVLELSSLHHRLSPMGKKSGGVSVNRTDAVAHIFATGSRISSDALVRHHVGP
mmetsp:Transcript_3399/g.6047  ORF Transcript_3399/g.6047 Transcript_3399/m.6047 type:complete len:184 (-) Transcript_3399:157-708(-)